MMVITMNKKNVAISVLVLILLIVSIPFFVRGCNNFGYNVQMADNQTNYNTLKEVEDTCRSLIVSYEKDKLYWEQYKDSPNKLERSWANDGKMRANQTAIKYNEYILKNKYIWKDNVPDDIKQELDILE